MSKVLEVLKRVDSILATEKQWTKGWSALDKRGHLVGPNAPEAVCWCLGGAIRKALDEIEEDDGSPSFEILVWDAISVAIPDGNGSITAYNDQYDRKFSEVKMVVSRAIEATSQ
jgi:hypothetical protein